MRPSGAHSYLSMPVKGTLQTGSRHLCNHCQQAAVNSKMRADSCWQGICPRSCLQAACP